MQSSGSQMARLVAAYRARASLRSPPLCSDPWAAALAGERGAEMARLYDQMRGWKRFGTGITCIPLFEAYNQD